MKNTHLKLSTASCGIIQDFFIAPYAQYFQNILFQLENYWILYIHSNASCHMLQVFLFNISVLQLE